MSYASAMSSDAQETGPPASRGPREGLAVRDLPRPPRDARWARVLVVFLAVALVVGWVVWYVRTPEPLPTDDRTVSAAGVVGTPLYLGMFTVPDGIDRELTISGVRVEARASDEVGIEPLLCQGGTIGVTTAPDQFCADLTATEGADVRPGDSVVLEVSGDRPVVAEIDRIRIAFREGLRFGTAEAGHAGATITLAASGA